MDNKRPYEIVSTSVGSIDVRVVEPCTAGELLQAMGCSKVVMGRVFATSRLLCGNESTSRGDRLDTGRVVELRLSSERVAGPASDHEPGILYEDRFLLAADKPAGLLVHGDGTGAETLAARVQGHVGRLGMTCPVQPIQRLDVDTTGVVLFSLADEFQPAFDHLVSEGGIRKRYLAVVEGDFPAGERVISLPVGRDRHDAQRMRVSVSGKTAITRVGRIAREDGHSLLLVELVTGRRHQIRVHLASKGFPIVGDRLYGGAAHEDGLMLHAYDERLTHPVTGEDLRIQTPWPARFERWFQPMELG